jgi:hypothetical protein
MASPRPSNIPPVWENQDIVLYHGTLKRFAELILQNGIDLSKSQIGRDFGIGFYTTTILYQAEDWAWQALRGKNALPDDTPAVLRYQIRRENLAKLDSLWFIDAQRSNEDFWSFIFHCRNGNLGHGRMGPVLYYDCVAGAVTASWEQRKVFEGTDQISFHTEVALSLLKNPQIVDVVE